MKRAAVALVGTAIALMGCAVQPSNKPPVLHEFVAPLAAMCDETLWEHVYAGDPRRFSKAQDRLKVIQDCVTVTGSIESAKPEADGDVHIRLKVDLQFQYMLNAKNMSGQHGYLVLEPVCVKAPTQRDTIEEHACDGFTQSFDRSLIHQRVKVTGAYVTDMEHGWNEIHPVTSISRE
jgi:hypothetical protein